MEVYIPTCIRYLKFAKFTLVPNISTVIVVSVVICMNHNRIKIMQYYLMVKPINYEQVRVNVTLFLQYFHV